MTQPIRLIDLANIMDEEPEKETEGETPKWIRRKGRSEVWKHLQVDPSDKTRVKCDYCPSIFKFSSSTTNLWRHLKEKHHVKCADDVEAEATEGSSTSNSNQVSIMQSMAKMGKDAPHLRDEVSIFSKAHYHNGLC